MSPTPTRTRVLLAPWLLVGVALCSLGCGADGGPVGTGIVQASIVGNVVDVSQIASLASAAASAGTPFQTELPPVEVSIDGRPGVATLTDQNGAFDLTGDVAGDVTLRFTTEDLSVTTELSVPADSIVSLTDVELSPAGVEVQAVRQLDFVGTVREADCAAGSLLVDDLSGRPFEIGLSAATTYEDDDGNAVACPAIAPGGRIAIDGIVDPDQPGTVIALRIVVGPVPSTPLEGPRAVPFFGFAVAVDCSGDGRRGRLALEDDTFGRTGVVIRADTSITRPDSTEITCDRIRVGDQVGGLGTWAKLFPGEIRADRMLVSSRPQPDKQLRFVGYLTKIDCTTGALELFFSGTLTDVVLLPTTVVRPERTCEQLALGDRLSGVGRLATDGSDAIEMTRVQVKKRK